jgi:hypothetical protein
MKCVRNIVAAIAAYQAAVLLIGVHGRQITVSFTKIAKSSRGRWVILDFYLIPMAFRSSLCVLTNLTYVRCNWYCTNLNIALRSALCTSEGAGYVYDNGTKSCHMINTKGPCGDLMKFVQNVSDPDYGECVCDWRKVCGRPVVKWPQDGACYFVYDQVGKQGILKVFRTTLKTVMKNVFRTNKETYHTSFG